MRMLVGGGEILKTVRIIRNNKQPTNSLVTSVQRALETSDADALTAMCLLQKQCWPLNIGKSSG